MMNKDQFYCVSCGKLMSNYEADKLFMTGFYRIVYPLGCCKDCMKQAAVADRRSRNLLNAEEAPPYDRFSAASLDMPKERFLVCS